MRISIDEFKASGLLKDCFANIADSKAACRLFVELGQIVATESGESIRDVQEGVGNSSSFSTMFIKHEKIFNGLCKIIFKDGKSKTTFVRNLDEIADILYLIFEHDTEIDYHVWHIYGQDFAITMNNDDAMMIKLTV